MLVVLPNLIILSLHELRPQILILLSFLLHLLLHLGYLIICLFGFI
jgi:hypothetical protein